MPATRSAPRCSDAAPRAASLATSAKRYRCALAGACLLVALWAGVGLCLWLVPVVASAESTLTTEAAAGFYHQHDRSRSGAPSRPAAPPYGE
jgi:hypothetical protein